MASIAVRDARSEDCEQILALLKELAVFEDDVDALHADVDWLRKYGFGEDKRCHYLVAEDPSTTVEGQSKLVGVLVYTWVHKITLRYTSMYIEDLYVTEGCRGRRVGRELLERAIQISKEQGYGNVQLITRRDNLDARRFYQHYGAVDYTNLKGWHYMELNPQ